MGHFLYALVTAVKVIQGPVMQFRRDTHSVIFYSQFLSGTPGTVGKASVGLPALTVWPA